jgi:hypothetical protein
VEFDHVPSLHKLPANAGVRFPSTKITENVIAAYNFFIEILLLPLSTILYFPGLIFT